MKPNVTIIKINCTVQYIEWTLMFFFYSLLYTWYKKCLHLILLWCHLSHLKSLSEPVSDRSLGYGPVMRSQGICHDMRDII